MGIGYTFYPGLILSKIKKAKGFGLLETHVDITGQKKLIDKLRYSQEMLEEAQRVAHIGHWELDPAIGTPVWSEEIFRMFGLDPDKGEPSFTDHETHLHPDDWQALNEAVKKASEDGTPFDLTFRIMRPNGDMGWMHAIGTASFDHDGKVVKTFWKQLKTLPIL